MVVEPLKILTLTLSSDLDVFANKDELPEDTRNPGSRQSASMATGKPPKTGASECVLGIFKAHCKYMQRTRNSRPALLTGKLLGKIPARCPAENAKNSASAGERHDEVFQVGVK